MKKIAVSFMLTFALTVAFGSPSASAGPILGHLDASAVEIIVPPDQAPGPGNDGPTIETYAVTLSFPIETGTSVFTPNVGPAPIDPGIDGGPMKPNVEEILAYQWN